MAYKFDVTLSQSKVLAHSTALAQSSALALATGLLFAANPAQAQSFLGIGTVTEGSATIVEGVDTTDVTVDSDSAVIDWDPFDDSGIGDVFFQDAGTTTTFTNGTGITNFAVLNRILPIDSNSRVILNGNIVSRIQDGMGGSVPGGTVFFYTPGGIIIGADAVIDVGNLGLTTADPVTDGLGNFIVADTVDLQPALGFSDIVIEQGAQIDALSEGSYVALFAPRIIQDGNINVNGQAAFVAAEAGTITFSPDGLFDIQVSVGTDAGFGTLEHSGTTTGPGTTGTGDNHRVYMVAVAKNIATTMAINGGSHIGFDVAQSATLDGDVVVLSAGHNIIAGEIDETPNGTTAAFINVNNNDFGNGTDVLFTSQVNARAANDININIGELLTFEESATFVGARINASVDLGFAVPGRIDALEDLSLIASAPRLGQDTSDAFLTLLDGGVVDVAGNLTLASNASVDANSSGSIQSQTARLRVVGPSQLLVGGNLVIDAGVDQTGSMITADALSGTAALSVEGGSVAVDGVTRIRSDAYGGVGSQATANRAELLVSQGGIATLGELNISADAIAGDDVNTGAGLATSGFAELTVRDAGSSLIVLSANTIGDAALGDLDFLSSEAIGGNGVDTNGGSAFTRSIRLTVENGATISLPTEIGNPLLILSIAIGGDTEEDDGSGGTGQTASNFLSVNDASGDLGLLAYRVSAQGGNAGSTAERTNGGNANTSFNQFTFFNSDVDVAFDSIVFEVLGGQASSDGMGLDGAAIGNGATFSITDSIVDVLSDLDIVSTGFEGDGSLGRASQLSLSLTGGFLSVMGNANLSGSQVNLNVDQSFDSGQSGVFQVDGDLALIATHPNFSGDLGDAVVTVRSSSELNVDGDLLLVARADADVDGNGIVESSLARLSVRDVGTIVSVGGDLIIDSGVDVATGPIGTTAQGGSAELTLVGESQVTVTGVTRVLTNAIAADSAPAFGGLSAVSVSGGGVLSTGELNVSSDAQGGNGALGSAGGDAISGASRINVDGTDSSVAVISANVTGDGALGELDFLSSQAIGGSSAFGAGGNADGGEVTLVVLNGGSVSLANSVGNPLTMLSTAEGGNSGADDSRGGDATAGDVILDVFNASGNLGRISAISSAVGGSSIGGNRTDGGDAFGPAAVNVTFIGSDIDVALEQARIEVIGGDGSADGLGDGGNASADGAFLNLNINNSTVDFLTDLQLSGFSRGGQGQNGGDATASSGRPSITNSTVNVVGDFRSEFVAEGGAGVGPTAISGGDATTQLIGATIDASTITATGDISFNAITSGGNSAFGDAGDAIAGETFIGLLNDTTIDAPNFSTTLNAIGGSILTGGTGNGGEASTGNATISLDAFSGVPVNILGDVIITTNALGGVAGATSGDGGSAIARNVEFRTFADGDMNVAGSVFLNTGAMGGQALSGVAGDAAAGRVAINLFNGGLIDIQGDANLVNNAVAGDGLTPGNATVDGGTLFALGELVIAGTTNINLNARGGDASASATPGAGGAAEGGFVQVTSRNNPGGDASLVSLGGLEINNVAQGGNGSDGIGAADGGGGGRAFGGATQVLGSAINGVLEILSDTNITVSATGGDGGRGEIGGNGGEASNGNINIGTASGGPVPDQVDGSATFTNVNFTATNTGGNGGESLNGTGGDGGAGISGGAVFLARGANVTANNVTFTVDGTGGNGGIGSNGISGAGGDGVAGSIALVVSEAFQNPGRGSLNLGTALLNATGQGGNGSTQGRSQFATDGEISFDQSDVVIGSLTYTMNGSSAPDFLVEDFANGGFIPVTVNPFIISFTDANVQIDVFDVRNGKDTTITSLDSTVMTDLFDVTAGLFTLAQNPPMGTPSSINAAIELALTSTQGDIEIDTVLVSDGNLILDSAGSITANDLAGPGMFLSAINGSIITGALLSPGGSVFIQAGDSIELMNVDADSISANSINGDITSGVPIALTGSLDLQAGGIIELADVTANSLTASTQGNGAITFNGALTIDQVLDVNAGGTITFAGVNAGSILAQSGGDIVASDLMDANGDIDLQSFGSIDLADVNASSLNAVNQARDIVFGGQLILSNALTVNSVGAIVFTQVSAGSVSGQAGGDITSADTISSPGDVALTSGGMIGLSNVNARDLNVATQGGGDIALDGPVVLSGALIAVSSGALAFTQVDATSIDGQAGGDITATDPLNAAEGIDLTSDGMIELAEVTAQTLSARTLTFGDINFTGTMVINGELNANSANSIFFLDANAGSISGTARGGITSDSPLVAITDIALFADGDVALNDVTAATITSRTLGNTEIGGQWTAEQVAISTSTIDFLAAGAIDTGTDGSIDLTSVNPSGILFSNGDPGAFDGLLIDADTFAMLTANTVNIIAAGDAAGPEIEIGDFDLSSNAGVTDLSFTTQSQTGEIFVSGNVIGGGGSLLNLTFNTTDFGLNSDTGSIDLLANGGSITINADNIFVGEADLFGALSGDETEEELAALINTAAAVSRPEGVLNAATLDLNANDAILIQNTGTDELPAGFTASNPEGLGIQASVDVSPLVIINGQFDDGAGNVLSGDDAATAFLDVFANAEFVNAGSQINVCALGGCDFVEAAAGDQGEITSTVSAAVNGVDTNSGTSTGGSNSGGVDNGTDGAGNGGDDGGDSDDGSSNSNSGTGAGTGSGSTGSNDGGEVTPDNVDDGGGNDDFAIDDSGSGDDSSSDTGSDDSSDGGDADDSDSGDSDSDQNEADESEEDESEEEETTEEEEEEAEAATSGPIAPPVSIIDTGTLDRRGAINDPISGSGNPALLDPDVATGGDDGNGGSNGNGEQP